MISTKLTCVTTTLREAGNFNASVNSTDVYSDLGNSGYLMITSTDAVSFETQETTIINPIVTPDNGVHDESDNMVPEGLIKPYPASDFSGLNGTKQPSGSARPNGTQSMNGSARTDGIQPLGGSSRPDRTQPLSGSARHNRTQPLGGSSRPDGTQPLGGSSRPDRTQPLSGSTRPNRTQPLDKSARSKGTPAQSDKRKKVQFTGTENQRKILDNTKYFMDYYFNPIVVIVGLLGKNIF